MRNISISDKEELYDVISALNAVIRELTKEIVELHGILLSTNCKMEDLL